ncbi:MAG: YqhA family protein [Desulfomonilaceae bacterium]|nr:YqhA family protein [Desulfomonilaceae bacterium]
MDLEKVFVFRHLCILPVVSALIGSLLMFLMGSAKTIQAISVLLTAITDLDAPATSPRSYEVAVLLIRSVDAFLVGLFLIVFAYSVYALFLKGLTAEQEAGPFEWLKMDGLDQLKKTVAQLVIIILFVAFLDRVIAAQTICLKYEELVLPAAILCLAAAKRLLREN